MADITITEVNADHFEVVAEVSGETKRYVFGLSQWGGNTVLRNAIANIEFRDTSGDVVAPAPASVTTVSPITLAHPSTDPNNKPQINKNSEAI